MRMSCPANAARLNVDGAQRVVAGLFPAQPSDGFKHREVRLTGAVVFEALPSTYPNALIRSDASRERVNQCSLADAGFSGNEYDLAFSCKHLVEPSPHPRQCSVAFDHSPYSAVQR